MDALIKTLNEQYKDQYAEEPPTSNEECQSTLNEILTECGIETKLEQKFKRLLTHEGGPYKNKTVFTEAGIVDIRTLNHNEANFVVKLRFNKKSCVPLKLLFKYLELDDFLKMYPNEKVNLLALNFKAKGDPAISDWVSVLHKDGEILDTQHQAACLDEPEFSETLYKNESVLHYFKKA